MSAFFLQHPKETDLALFAGGELGPFARWRIERHLETCKECEQTVADFFHLADELSPLADVPDMDWSAMARDIGARLAVEGPAPEGRRGVPAWTWQLGAAAACAVVAVAVWNIGPKAGNETYAPAAEQVVAQKSMIAESANAPAASEPMERDEEVAPARQLGQVVARNEAESVLEKKRKAEETEMLAFADRADERFSTDAAAPAPPTAAKAVSMEVSVPAERTVADKDVLLLAQESRARRAQALGGRVSAPAQADVLGLAEGLSAEPVYGVRPLPAAGESVQVGAGGWISVSADGAMTITEVYDAQ